MAHVSAAGSALEWAAFVSSGNSSVSNPSPSPPAVEKRLARAASVTMDIFGQGSFCGHLIIWIQPTCRRLGVSLITFLGLSCRLCRPPQRPRRIQELLCLHFKGQTRFRSYWPATMNFSTDNEQRTVWGLSGWPCMWPDSELSPALALIGCRYAWLVFLPSQQLPKRLIFLWFLFCFAGGLFIKGKKMAQAQTSAWSTGRCAVVNSQISILLWTLPGFWGHTPHRPLVSFLRCVAAVLADSLQSTGLGSCTEQMLLLLHPLITLVKTHHAALSARVAIFFPFCLSHFPSVCLKSPCCCPGAAWLIWTKKLTERSTASVPFALQCFSAVLRGSMCVWLRLKHTWASSVLNSGRKEHACHG